MADQLQNMHFSPDRSVLTKHVTQLYTEVQNRQILNKCSEYEFNQPSAVYDICSWKA